MFLPLSDDTPRLRAPVITAALIVASVLVHAYQLVLTPAEALRLARATGVVPYEIAHLTDLVGWGQPKDVVPPPFTIFTSLFVHGDVLHLLGNMWFLWVFGSKLEGYLGPWRYLGFYLLAGTTAALVQVAAAPSSTLPMIGASGAIAGLLGGYAFGFPRARVRCLVFLVFFITFVELRALALLGVWFLAQFVSARAVAGAHGGEPGIAWFAHIGGFVTGLALAPALLRAPRRAALMYHLPSWAIPRESASWSSPAW